MAAINKVNYQQFGNSVFGCTKYKLPKGCKNEPARIRNNSHGNFFIEATHLLGLGTKDEVSQLELGNFHLGSGQKREGTRGMSTICIIPLQVVFSLCLLHKRSY